MIAALRDALEGRLVMPGDAQYDTLRRVFNGAIDRRPAAIALCRAEDDILRALEASHAMGLRVSVRSSGHNVAGRCVQDGALLIDLSQRNEVRTNRKLRTVSVGAGVTWGELDASTQAFGLAVTGGTVPSTGVTGLTLGGGVGWLLPSFGLSCDNLRAARVLSTDGKAWNASDEEAPQLIRALRGGGYGLGVVVDLEFDLHPLDHVIGGAEVYRIDDAVEVLGALEHRWSDFPPTVMLSPALLWFGSEPVLELDVVVNGDGRDWERIKRHFPRKCVPLSSTIRRRSYCDMQGMLDNPKRRGMGAYWKSGFVRALNREVVSALVEAIKSAPNDKCLMMIEHYHGQYAQGSWTRSAYPHRDESLNVLIVSSWEPGGQTNESGARAWAVSTYDAIAGALTGQDYCNYVSEDSGGPVLDASLEQVRTQLDSTSILLHSSGVRD